MKKIALITLILLNLLVSGQNKQSTISKVDIVQIVEVEPTPLFPKPQTGKPLQQIVRLRIHNSGKAFSANIKVTTGNQKPEISSLGTISVGSSVVEILIPDRKISTMITLEIQNKDGQLLATHKLELKPQKKWTIFSCAYSHQDLGFGDYPHRLRTSIRHENIKLPLKFCRETDDWQDDSKYRFNIETSEPLTSFISFNGKDAARELAQRMREGRIELGGLHNTANTEQLSHELLARLFYMTGRHAVDILGVPAGKTIQEDDVIGISWPVATYAREAGFEYCFHGFNRICMPNIVNGVATCEFNDLDSEKGKHVFSIGNEPNFYWQGPDGQRLLRRATTYERNGLLDNPYEKNPAMVQDPARVEMLVRGQEKINWPFDVMLSQDGGDFILVRRAISDRAVKWNAEYCYPRIRLTTFDDYFRTIEKEIAEKNIKLNTIAEDENNQWSDQDYAAARATGKARRLTEMLPATETLAVMAQALAGGGEQWMNLFQGYHRLLQYFEHTNAKDSDKGNMCWYETELEENREMVGEAEDYQEQVFANASRHLSDAIVRRGDKNLIVFNPLPYQRTDIVHADIPADLIPVDAETGKNMPVQQLPDGSSVFVAENIPATGYRTYELIKGQRAAVTGDLPVLESEFYRIKVNRSTGVITSLFDKTLGVELIETNTEHNANEYIYESNGKRTVLTKADVVSIERGPVADVLTVKGKADGVKELNQTVLLYHALNRVDFQLWMDKAPAKGKEAVFVEFPFNVPGFAIHHELPGAVVEPYREQVDGSATDHFAIRSFTDLSNDKYGVTVSPVEGSLVSYGAPTTEPWSYDFKRDRTYPSSSRLYLYLLNNMFGCNIAVDQRGPISFQWALRSHAGDWKKGAADVFGRSVQQPLLVWRADGKNNGTMKSSGSFMSVDVPNVMCSVVKPAEMNGDGIVLRFNETQGRETTVKITLPMLPEIKSVRMLSLVENNTEEVLPVNGNSFSLKMPKYGVKTVRVLCEVASINVKDLQAKSVADMQVDLKWNIMGKGVSHFNIYRDTRPECESTMLNFIGQSAAPQFSDIPRANIGGWLRSCLAPETKYYYRVIAVDRLNNRIGKGDVVEVATLASAGKNLSPVAVEGVRAVLVSPLRKKLNYVNLLFRTACEQDVSHYEIHRSTQSGFAANDGTQVGIVKSDDVPVRSGGYGESAILYKNREYDHAMFQDKTVEPGNTYYYKICAVDATGQKGAFSAESVMATKNTPASSVRTSAQSCYSEEYDSDFACDGEASWESSWVSKPYGGGTKEEPKEVWLSVELPKTISLKGIKVIGDNRPQVAQISAFQIQMRIDGAWKNVAAVKNVKGGESTVVLDTPVMVDGIKLIFSAGHLPVHIDPSQNGIVRINEISTILADGKEMFMNESELK